MRTGADASSSSRAGAGPTGRCAVIDVGAGVAPPPGWFRVAPRAKQPVLELAHKEHSDPNLSCAVCLSDLAWDPVMTSCHHLFCRHCVAGVPTCPTCRAPVTAASLTPLSSNVMVSRMHGSKRVHCPFHGAHQLDASKGAGAAAAGAGAAAVCGWVGEASEAAAHEVSCSCVVLQCEHCGQTARRSEAGAHYRSACPSRPHRCEFCGESVVWSSYEAHVRAECRECPDTVVACGVPGCSSRVMRREVAQHMASGAVEHTMLLCSMVQQGPLPSIRCFMSSAYSVRRLLFVLRRSCVFS